MSSPSSRTWPDTPAPTTTSCMRLSVRRKVDFPQPDGPITAVTRLASTVRVTLSMARVDPYQALTPTASIDLDMVLPGRSCRTARVAMCSADLVCRQHDDKGAGAPKLDLSTPRRGPGSVGTTAVRSPSGRGDRVRGVARRPTRRRPLDHDHDPPAVRRPSPAG